MSKANSHQVGGTHYAKQPLEHWDLVGIYGWDYFQARSIAYIMRWRDKGGIQDLEKARHFIDKYIEIEKMRSDGNLTERLLADAMKKLNTLQADEEDDEVAVQYNVSGDAPLLQPPRPVAKR